VNQRSGREAGVQPLRDRVRSATREAILSAAEATFARRGVAGAHMEEIAAQAGVAVGTLYNYFDDRSALLAAVLQSNGNELAAQLDAGLPPASAPFEEQLRSLVSVVFAHVGAHFELFAMLAEEELASGRLTVGGRRCPPPALHALYERAAAVVAAGVAQGAVREDAAGLQPALLLGMMRGVFRWRLFATERPAMAELVEPVVRTFLHGAGRAP
jgi:AcrR family transcriptional regulator